MITDTAFSALMEACAPFETAPQLAIAVSGGADSMALLLLAHRWAQARGGKVTSLTIDHGLRAESAVEADTVRRWCRARAIRHEILKIQDSGFRIEGTAIQEMARTARYHLLADWCKAHHVLHLLTAHHRDDQVETLMFRLARGSGIDGLAAMPLVSKMHGIRLLRPLLPVTKLQLEDTLRTARQAWTVDPSNRNSYYTRNHIRNLWQNSRVSEPLSPRAEAVMVTLGNTRNSLEYNIASYLTNCIYIMPEGYGILQLESFRQLPREYGLRVLTALTLCINGGSYPPRSEKLERLYGEFTSMVLPVKRSFAGLLFIHQPRQQRLLICREPAAVAPPVQLASSVEYVWDQRFQVYWQGESVPPVSVRALGADGMAFLKKRAPSSLRRLPKSVLLTLPSLWRLETLLTVPHIHYHHPDPGGWSFSARLMPAKALAGPPFSGMNRKGVLESERA